MSQPYSEFTHLPKPFDSQESLAFTDLAPADAGTFAERFLELRELAWNELAMRNIVAAEDVERLYAPTATNVSDQLKYIRGADTRTHYVAVTKRGGDVQERDNPGLVALGKVRSHPPELVGSSRVTVCVEAIDVLPEYQMRGVGTLLLQQLLDFYKTEPYANEQHFMMQVPRKDQFLIGWLTRRGMGQIAPSLRGKQKDGHVMHMGGVMQVSRQLDVCLQAYGANTDERIFYVPKAI